MEAELRCCFDRHDAPRIDYWDLCMISGADVISINDQYVYGFTAFAASIAIMFLFSFVFGTLWTFVQWLGFIIYSRFRPMRLRYYELK